MGKKISLGEAVDELKEKVGKLQDVVEKPSHTTSERRRRRRKKKEKKKRKN